jgi:hypothetical protein
VLTKWAKQLGDEDDEDDPFAELEEGFDEMGRFSVNFTAQVRLADVGDLDLQANIARDKHARLCTQVESLIGSLKTSQAEDTLADLSEQLVWLPPMHMQRILTDASIDGNSYGFSGNEERHYHCPWNATYTGSAGDMQSS